MITIRDIAKKVGVSRGTVDRALNNRDGIRKETRDKIIRVAQEMNYIPNVVGKHLAVSKKSMKIAYIYFDNLPYSLRAQPYVNKRIHELEQYGISVLRFPCALSDYSQEHKALDIVKAEGVSGIVIAPIQQPGIAAKLRCLADEGVAIVTIHADLPECGRIAYVGDDYYKSGRMAANVMGLLCGGKGRIGAVVNFEQLYHHEMRIAGFMEKMKESFPAIDLLPPYYNQANAEIGYTKTKEFLKQHPEVTGLFLECTYVEGICKAINESNRNLAVVAFDNRKEIWQYVRIGIVDALIVQQDSYQAEKPFDILYNLLILGEYPSREVFYVPSQIKVEENL